MTSGNSIANYNPDLDRTMDQKRDKKKSKLLNSQQNPLMIGEKDLNTELVKRDQ